MSLSPCTLFYKIHRESLLAVLFSVLFVSCNVHRAAMKPSIQLTKVPVANPGGPERLDYIEGRVSGAKAGQQVVLYTRSGAWWIQPLTIQPFTKIQPDSTWKNSTHLGTEYAALLVDAGYRPSAKINLLPKEGNGVIAIAVAAGRASAPIITKVLHFSGYDWNVRSAGSDRGGAANAYDPANAWTDKKGFLHLRMTQRDGRWSCAEVSLARSFGFGSYVFVVQDSTHLEPAAVFSMFTFDDSGAEDNRRELDIEMSRWGNPASRNAQYVVQPFYVPANVARFAAPPGALTHTLRWEPGSATFKTFRGFVADVGSKTVAERVFTSGVPTPGSETVHIVLYAFHHSKVPLHDEAEVVIEKFEYLP